MISDKKKARMGIVKLQITNIHRDLSEKDLRSVFEKLGALKECTLVMDAKTGGSKGFAFVVYENPALHERAVEEFNGRKVNFQPIKVKIKR